MTLAQDNIAICLRLIQHAEEELANGEPLQASEKAWGAVAHRLKAIARQRKWRHGGHYHLGQIIRGLVDETGDGEIQNSFSIAESLHANFYNNWKTEAAVRDDIESVKLLLDKLSTLYDNSI
jgi:hypothetical protein